MPVSPLRGSALRGVEHGPFRKIQRKWMRGASVVAKWGLVARIRTKSGRTFRARRDEARHGPPRPQLRVILFSNPSLWVLSPGSLECGSMWRQTSPSTWPWRDATSGRRALRNLPACARPPDRHTEVSCEALGNQRPRRRRARGDSVRESSSGPRSICEDGGGWRGVAEGLPAAGRLLCCSALLAS